MKISNLLIIAVIVASMFSCKGDAPTKHETKTPEKTVQKDVPKIKSKDASQLASKGDRDAKIEALKKKYEEAKSREPNAEQKAVGDKICSCMSAIKINKTALTAKSEEDFNKAVGSDKYKEVKALQDCHNTIMPAALKGKEDPGIWAMLSRKHVNNTCLNGNEQVWFYIGNYIKNNRTK